MLADIATALFAVHISDNILDAWCWGGGLVAAAALAVLGAWRIRDEEIPRVALLTAAYFVATAIHLPVWPTSIHLLFNSLVGVLLGWRCCLAIPLGIGLQYLLIQHGGFYTVGINSLVQIVPALGAHYLFAALRRLPWRERSWFRPCLIGVCCVVGLFTATYSVALLCTNFLSRHDLVNVSGANAFTFHPITIAVIVLASAVVVWLQRHLQYSPEFALGVLVGELTVLGTVALNNLVLLWGGETYWREPALLILVASVPLAVIEGLVVGFTVAFLARVKPELLGDLPLPPPSRAPVSPRIVHVGPSLNGEVGRTSHEPTPASVAPPCPAPEPGAAVRHNAAGTSP